MTFQPLTVKKNNEMEDKMHSKRISRLVLIAAAIFIVSCRSVVDGMALEERTAVPTAEPTAEPTMESTTEPTRVYIPLVTNTKFEEPTPNPSPTSPNEGGFYVTTDGSPKGDGSMSRPWDINTALSHPDSVKPGDTIWIRGGVYGKGGQTIFNSKLKGDKDKPITVRAYPNERATLNGNVMVYNPWVVFWGLEVMNSDTKRTTDIAGSHPNDILRSDGFLALAPNTKYINNIIRDGAGGIAAFAESQDTEIYGNIIYNNGWYGPDRGHGHGIYGQNETGWKTIDDNVIFNNFSGYGVHIYGENALLNNFLFEGNINFNGRFLVGGSRPSNNIMIVDNYLYNSNMQVGRSSEGNTNLTLTGNYLGGENTQSLEVKLWQNLIITDNKIWNAGPFLVSLLFPDKRGTYRWNDNEYFAPSASAFKVDDLTETWSTWIDEYGFDQNGSFKLGLPTSVEIFIRPNKYEEKRANIIIYNWNLRTEIPVDVSSLNLEIGDKYVLHNVQNFYNETIEGIYNGEPIRVPMIGWTAAIPVGWSDPISSSTLPKFGVFLLTVE